MEPLQPLPIGQLLVPLDGSRLAEAPLPAATALAERLGARVTLLHVLERNAPATIHGERHLTDVAAAEAYLRGIASRFADLGIPVEIHAHPSPEGDVAASIAAHAAEVTDTATLIVLCTHGQGGPREWLSGSLAQRAVRRAGAPILLVRPGPGGINHAFTPRAVIVALDGTPVGEAALPAALTLARAFGAVLRLVVVVATLGTISGDRAAAALLTPTATAAALDLEEATATAYLTGLQARLQEAQVAVRTQVARGDAVRQVTESATRDGAGDVLALATHGKAGLDALWSGSIGAKVVTRSANSLLLVRPAR
ncbi:MAG: universal stress protein [Thermomicrobiales bacterium]